MTIQLVPHNLEYRFVTTNDVADFVEKTFDVFEQAYPKFLTRDVLADPNSLALFEVYPEFQFGLVENSTQRMVAQGSCLPLVWERSFEELPDEGCDWALTKGMEDREKNRQPNALCAVSISILPEYRDKNLSQYMLGYMKELAQIHRLSSLIMAARPSLKHLYPLTPIGNYITWQAKNDLTFDPWLRVNLRNGAKMAGICSKSTTITDTIAGWENRVGMRFPETGDYIIPGGLVPVKIDYLNNLGSYIEPNLWLYYK